MAKQRRVAVMVELDWPYKRHTEVFAGCQQYASEAGWDCIIHPFVDQEMQRRGSGGGFDGVLARATRQLADEAKLAGVPVVNVWINSPVGYLPSVLPDTEELGAMAARHLLGRGFRQFGFLCYSRDKSSQLELKGFRSVIEPAGFSCSVHRYAGNSPTRAKSWGGFISDLEAWVDTWETPIGVYGNHDLACR
jgi:LacI family transcriptional regulator